MKFKMMRNDVRALSLSLIFLFLAGCAAVKQERIVLLPNAAGQTGSVTVKTSETETVLDKPYSAVDVGKKGRIETKTCQPEQVKQQFGSALAAQPAHPASFMLYFILDKDELTPESRPKLDLIKAELTRRPAPEIMVIGHTDKVGTEGYNEVLSIKRAEAIRRELIKAGISGEKIEAVGRGKLEPLVPTAEGVPEPRNRRVEINVR